MSTSTLTRTDVEERERVRRAEDLHRKRRVELLEITPFCHLCGGATGEVPDVDEPDELACVCSARALLLQSRLAEIVADHRRPAEPHWQDRT